MRHAAPRSGKAADDPANDRLTEQGRQQALAAARRLVGVGLTAVVSAPEQRTRDTALAITMMTLLPMASVDGALTSKAYSGESPVARGQRGIVAVNRFMAATQGSVAVVSHGHIIHNMCVLLTGRPVTPDVVATELVNAGIIKMQVTYTANGTVWTQLSSDTLVRDDA